MTKRLSITTQELGYGIGHGISDITSAGDIDSAVVARIVVQCETVIQSIKFHYVGNQQSTVGHKSMPTERHEIILNQDEWITSIRGTGNGGVITSITFFSNKQRTWGPIGAVSESHFVWEPVGKVPSYILSRMGLVCLEGAWDNCIRVLKATFAVHSIFDKTPVLLKYENPKGDRKTCQSSGIFSRFERQLMCPIVILRIGPDNTQFRAHEDILCQLTFFRAALQGGFRECLDKTIAMPDDEPGPIAALIEFLSTGSYTYAYMPDESGHAEATGGTDDIAGNSDFPVTDITEGIFHAAVHATASKYDCEELAQGSLKNFALALIKLEGLDVIKLWRAVYPKGVNLSQFETDSDLKFYTNGLHQFVEDAYSTDREEMERIVSEDPAFANDLLRLITNTKSPV